MSGISGLSGAEDIREEGESSSGSFDKRDAKLSSEIKELLSSHDSNNGNSLKEEQPLDSEKDKGPKKSILISLTWVAIIPDILLIANDAAITCGTAYTEMPTIRPY